MTKVIHMFKKDLSQIKNIQDTEKLYYNFYETENPSYTTYGIEIISKKKNKSETTSLQQISESKCLIINIITYLYENSIKPNSACGIISDLINADFLRN